MRYILQTVLYNERFSFSDYFFYTSILDILMICTRQKRKCHIVHNFRSSFIPVKKKNKEI